MQDKYDIAFPPELDTRHVRRLAIDVTIDHNKYMVGKTLQDASGKMVFIHTPADLFAVGATYKVFKLVKDRPHWSVDGH